MYLIGLSVMELCRIVATYISDLNSRADKLQTRGGVDMASSKLLCIHVVFDVDGYM